jgi:hypothetical protein
MFQIQVAEEIRTHFYVQKRFSQNCAAYEIMWENILQADRPEMKTQHGAEKMRFA